jgi:predicted Zn-dependent protease
VEKMGEFENWTQIRVKKNGTIGYVSSRYLSPQPVNVAQLTKKKTKKAKPPKATQLPEAAREEGKAGPQKQEPSPPLTEPEDSKGPRVM